MINYQAMSEKITHLLGEHVHKWERRGQTELPIFECECNLVAYELVAPPTCEPYSEGAHLALNAALKLGYIIVSGPYADGSAAQLFLHNIKTGKQYDFIEAQNEDHGGDHAKATAYAICEALVVAEGK